MPRILGKPVTVLFSSVRFMGRGSLLLRFSILSFVVLALLAFALQWVFQQQAEQNALAQQADEVAVVLDGTMNRHFRANDISVTGKKAWLQHWQWLAGTLLQADRHLVRVKVWDRTGRIVYSNDPRQIGQRYPIDDNLRTALNGQRAMDVSTLAASENALDRRQYSSLLETYVPIHGWGKVIGAYEAYSDLSGVRAEMNQLRPRIWLSVGVGFLLLYLSLFAIVSRASQRLVRQMQAITRLEIEARAVESLRQVDRLKDEFIGSVSHELRRPLASIKGYTGSLLLPGAHWDAAMQREFLQVIDEETDQLALLIDNLLDVARLDAGALPLQREPIHVPVIAEQVVRRIRAQAHLPPHPYDLQFPDRFPFIDADPERIAQLLMNLVENAAKYAPPRTPVLIAGKVDGAMVEVDVVDRGPGLTADQAAHVFDRFYRVDASSTRATEGSGLGLAICRGIVTAHGGTLRVASVPGQGSTFTFRLPVHAIEADENVADARLPAVATASGDGP